MSPESGAPPHIKARLTLLPTSDGGRTSPVSSGYRPHFRYQGEENGVTVYLDRDWLFPGESADVTLVFLRPELQRGRLVVNSRFELSEGLPTVARGVILEVYALKMAATHNF